MVIDKHIYFTKEEYKSVYTYAKENKLSYSRATCNLVMIALNNISLLEKLDSLSKDLKYVGGKVRTSHLLLEQIYSNFDFENIINPKDSKQLKQFNSKLKGNNIND